MGRSFTVHEEGLHKKIVEEGEEARIEV